MKQDFFCKKCNTEFSIENDDKYYNWNCPNCNETAPIKGWNGLAVNMNIDDSFLKSKKSSYLDSKKII